MSLNLRIFDGNFKLNLTRPCANSVNHALNVSLGKSSSVQSVRNAVGTVKEVIAFFNASAKRNFILISVAGGQLQSLCATCWVERHDSLLQCCTTLCHIVRALTIISKWDDCDSSCKANILVHAWVVPSSCFHFRFVWRAVSNTTCQQKTTDCEDRWSLDKLKDISYFVPACCVLQNDSTVNVDSLLGRYSFAATAGKLKLRGEISLWRQCGYVWRMNLILYLKQQLLLSKLARTINYDCCLRQLYMSRSSANQFMTPKCAAK